MAKSLRQKRDRSPYGQRLHDLYSRKFESASAFARAIHIKPSSLHEVEYGESSYLNVVNSLEAARILDTTVEYLTHGTGPMKRTLSGYDSDVADIATALMKVQPKYRRMVKSMVDQIIENTREERIATKREHA